MNVLVVEDEAIVALDLSFMVEDLGHAVVATCGTVNEGLSIIEALPVDVALLDVQLLDGEVYPLADALHERGTGLVFHSGHAELSEITARYPRARFCPKPTSFRELSACFASLAGEAGAGQSRQSIAAH